MSQDEKGMKVRVPVVMLANEALEMLARAIRGEPITGERAVTAGAMDARVVDGRPYYLSIFNINSSWTGTKIIAPPQAGTRLFIGAVYMATSNESTPSDDLILQAYGENVEGGTREVFTMYPNEDYGRVLGDEFAIPMRDGEGLQFNIGSGVGDPVTLLIQYWRIPTTDQGVADIATPVVEVVT